jgi:hypothetical protein
MHLVCLDISCVCLLCCWLQELEKHTAAFVEQARLLATWDSAVLSNRHALVDLEAELRAVHAGQEALDRQLGMIETHQKVGQHSQKQPALAACVHMLLLSGPSCRQ